MAAAAQILSKQIICKEPGRYIGWPTIIRTRAGELIIAFSGDRDSHICPYGKTEIVRSQDEGRPWSEPVVILNTPLDDRDAGLVETPDGTLISSWFTSVEFGDNPVHKAHAKTLSQQVRDRWKGHWTQRSTDSGLTGRTRSERWDQHRMGRSSTMPATCSISVAVRSKVTA